MPVIWLEYLDFLSHEQALFTRTRSAFDRALKALPITQHSKIWQPYLEWVRHLGIAETAIRVYRRYLKLDEDAVEDYLEFLLHAESWGEASEQLSNVLNRPRVISRNGKTHHQLWQVSPSFDILQFFQTGIV